MWRKHKQLPVGTGGEGEGERQRQIERKSKTGRKHHKLQRWFKSLVWGQSFQASSDQSSCSSGLGLTFGLTQPPPPPITPPAPAAPFAYILQPGWILPLRFLGS